MKKYIVILSLIIVGLISFIVQDILIKPNNQKLLSNPPQIIYKTKIIYKKIPLDPSQIIVNKQYFIALNQLDVDTQKFFFSSGICKNNTQPCTTVGNPSISDTSPLGQTLILDSNIQDFIKDGKID